MAFSYNGSNLPCLSTYAHALSFWQRADTWKGEDNERILDNRKKRTVNIRQLRDGSIACRLYNTDVVTYHPGDILTIKPWASVSTDEFANRLLGQTNIDPLLNTGYIRTRHVRGQKFYRAIDTIELAYDPTDREYYVTSTPEPFEIAKVNKKEANKVLKEYDYHAFANWVRMLEVSGVKFEQYTYWPSAQAVDALPDREQWYKLLCHDSAWHNRGALLVNRTLTETRKSLYQFNPQVYDVATIPYLTEWSEVERWKRSRRL